MQTTKHGLTGHRPNVRTLNDPRLRRILPKPEMRPRLVVVRRILLQHPLQMPLAQHNLPIDLIPIPNQVAGRRVKWERLDQLQTRPFSSGVLGGRYLSEVRSSSRSCLSIMRGIDVGMLNRWFLVRTEEMIGPTRRKPAGQQR